MGAWDRNGKMSHLGVNAGGGYQPDTRGRKLVRGRTKVGCGGVSGRAMERREILDSKPDRAAGCTGPKSARLGELATLTELLENRPDTTESGPREA